MTPTSQVSDRRARAGAATHGVLQFVFAGGTAYMAYVLASSGIVRGALVAWYVALAVVGAPTLVTIGVALLRSRRAAPPLLAVLTRTVRRCYWVAGGLLAAAIVGPVLGALMGFVVAMPVVMSLVSAPSSLWYLKHFAATGSEHLGPPAPPQMV